MADVISMLNMKGGVGKTTLATNLAWHCFRSGGKKVLLVDLDPQFNASQYMMDYSDYESHVKTAGTVADLLIEQPILTLRKKPQKPSIDKCLYELEQSADGESYLHLLPSELALSHVVKNPAQMDFMLEKLLQPIRSGYDLVFIDCAPTDSVLTTMALTASDYLLIPVRPDRFSILGFTMVLNTIRLFRQRCPNPHDVAVLGIVFTQVRNTSNVETECINDIRKEALGQGEYVFASSLDFSNTFLTAIQNQTPAFETRYAREELKQSIARVVVELSARIEECAAQRGAR